MLSSYKAEIYKKWRTNLIYVLSKNKSRSYYYFGFIDILVKRIFKLQKSELFLKKILEWSSFGFCLSPLAEHLASTPPIILLHLQDAHHINNLIQNTWFSFDFVPVYYYMSLNLVKVSFRKSVIFLHFLDALQTGTL